jgi:PhzF family phenazine biosynthesis protein
MGAAETAFVVKSGAAFDLRWFTCGGAEVDLCGHATLATTYILVGKGYANEGETLRFQTKSGLLTARREGAFVTLDFPREKTAGVKNSRIDFKKLLGFVPLFTGRTRFDYFLVADSENTVRSLAPDFGELKKVATRGFIITAPSASPGYDFVSRFFALAIGIDEDPVTGSAHCALGPYWGAILKKDKLVGYQASREGGIVRVQVLEDRVLLSGKVREVPLPDATGKTV